jgi:ribosomal protein S18 acetylase RimI-like enzyme
MEIIISKFTIESYDRVLNLWEQCEGIGLSNSDSKENIQLYLNRNPGMSFIAELGNQLVGAILAGHDGRRGYIHHLAVLPNYRRQGIGSLMVKNSLNKLKDRRSGRWVM